jgi:hypothetical protein
MSECSAQNLAVCLPSETAVIARSRQIEATDGAIDTLVYELYGLTPEEIVIVEGN